MSINLLFLRPLLASAVSCVFCVHTLSRLRVLRHHSDSEASHALTENVKYRKLNLQDVLCILSQIFPIGAEVAAHQGALFFEDSATAQFFLLFLLWI